MPKTTPSVVGARNLTTTRKLIALKWAPSAIRQAFRRASSPVCAEEFLWREVAARMTLDAIGYTGLAKLDHDKNMRAAKTWFKYSKDVRDVFDMAGVDYIDVKRSIINYLEKTL